TRSRRMRGSTVEPAKRTVTSAPPNASPPCSPRSENPATCPTMSPDIESRRSPARILSVMAFPWDTLITADFTVGGVLGGVWLKGRQDTDRDRRRATQAAEAAQAHKQQAACTDLVVTARQALSPATRPGCATSVTD